MIEILLRETIDNLGRCGEVVTVANGYARNYLLPRQLALPVTEANRRQVEREREAAEVHEAEARTAAEALAARIAGLECVIACRVGETETLYGSVTNADIAEFLTSQRFEIEKRKIVLEGNLPSVLDPPLGCPFCTRCPHKLGDICENERPPVQMDGEDHAIACHIPLDELRKAEPVVKVPSDLEKKRSLLMKEALAKKMAAEAAEAEMAAAAAKAKAAAAAAAVADAQVDAATAAVEGEQS